jgi:hypothetical protein
MEQSEAFRANMAQAHPSLRRALLGAWPSAPSDHIEAEGLVPAARVAEFLEFVAEKAPRLKVAFKDEGYPSLYWKILGLFVSLWCWVQPSFKERWNLRISNAGGGWLLFPSADTHLDLRQPSVFGVWRHEFVHYLDAQEDALFSVKYVLWPLPVLWARSRANAEFRAYAQQVLTWWEVDGALSDESTAYMEAHFWGSLYFFMWPWKAGVRARYARLRDRVRAGDLEPSFWHSQDQLHF